MDEIKFRRYEEDFVNSSRIIGRGMRLLENANGNVDSVICASVDIEGELSEAEGYVRAMEILSKTMIVVDKRPYFQKVIDYKDEYDHLLKKYQSAKTEAEYVALKGGSAARAKLITANQKLDQSTLLLEESRNILHNTEQVGTVILGDLEGQKEKMLSAQTKVKDTKKFTSDAKSILQEMGNRAIIQKILLLSTIVVLFVVICVIIYYGLIAKK